MTRKWGMAEGKVVSRATRETVRDNVARLLEASGKSERQLALDIGIGHGSLQRYRLLEAGASVDVLAAVAEHFGFEAWQLLVPDFDPDAPPVLGTETRAQPVPAAGRKRPKEKVNA